MTQVRHQLRDAVRSPGADGVLAGALGALALVDAVYSGDWPQPTAACAALAAVAGAVLVVRRTRPFLAFSVCLGSLAAVLLLIGHFEAGSALLIVMVAAYSVGAHVGSLRPAVLVAAVFVAAMGARQSLDEAVGDMVFTAVLVGLPLAVGRGAHHLRERSAALEQEAARLREEQQRAEVAASAAAEQERRRIARELHDIVSHGLGVVVLHAGVAEEVLEKDPERARASLALVRRVGQEAIGEMGTLVGLMREDVPAQRTPQPTLADLDRLVAGLSETGLDVELVVEGQTGRLPAAMELSAYRVVQEGLTNAMKHAPAAHVRVVVRVREETLEVEVADDGTAARPGPGSRHGLVGLRERVAVFGGSLVAGRRDSGGWAVSARFPLVRDPAR